jgi:membrane protein YqaA with SNARE-associated domain
MLVMKHLSAVLFAVMWKLGGLGLLLLGILDSSFLVAPFGNDLLVIAMTSRNRDVMHMLYYSFMSSVGSVLGVALIDWVVRGLGEAGLERHLPQKRLAYVENKVKQNAVWALVLASIAPPPFPFTPFIVAASALQYPRKKLFTVVGLARMVRFVTLGILALLFGARILHWFANPVVEGFFIGLLVLAIVGSVVSVYGWIKRSRNPAPVPQPDSEPAVKS